MTASNLGFAPRITQIRGASFFPPPRSFLTMKTLLLLALTAVITTSGLLACTDVTTDTIPPVSAANLLPVKKTMKAFGSEQELLRYFRELAQKSRRERRGVE